MANTKKKSAKKTTKKTGAKKAAAKKTTKKAAAKKTTKKTTAPSLAAPAPTGLGPCPATPPRPGDDPIDWPGLTAAGRAMPGLLSFMYHVKFNIHGANRAFHGDMADVLATFGIRGTLAEKIIDIHHHHCHPSVAGAMVEAIFKEYLVEEVMYADPRKFW